VGGVLAQTIATVARLPDPPRLVVAGRTDAGVHARGQVAHLDLMPQQWSRVQGTLLRRLAAVLPPDVRVTGAAGVPSSFDARFSARSRHYAYRVWDREYRADPLRRDVLWLRRSVAEEAMNEASAGVLGEHDFISYCRPRGGASTTRRLLRLDWKRDQDGLLVAHVEGQAFCHNQVRALAGAMLAVGSGRRPPSWPAEVLRARERGRITVAPAHGLTLESVSYTDLAEVDTDNHSVGDLASS
jgi:tRNA pseudouridine38-40 synthase